MSKLIFSPTEIGEEIEDLSIRSVRVHGRSGPDPYVHLVLSDGSTYDLRVVHGATLEAAMINIVGQAQPITNVVQGWPAPLIYELQLLSAERIQLMVRITVDKEISQPPIIIMVGRA